MNKTQLACLLCSLAVAFMVFAWRFSSSHKDLDLMSVTDQIANDLIKTTNSQHLPNVPREELSKLLRFPTRIEVLKRGDVSPPFGDGTAVSHFILSNDLGERLGIRIGRFTNSGSPLGAVGFWAAATRVEPQ